MLQHVINILVLAGIYTVFALGLSLSWGVLNILNLAHGSILMFGAVAVYSISTSVQGMPAGLVLAAAIVICGSLALALERLVFLPIRRRASTQDDGELRVLISSIALAAVPVAAAISLTDGEIKSIPESVVSTEVYHVGDAQFTSVGVVIVVVSVLLCALLWWLVNRTKFGHALRALAADREVVPLLGISPNRLAATTMFASGALAGIAGVLLAVQTGTVSAYMGEPLLLKAFAVIIVGGVGSIAGGAVAALLLATVETVMQVYVAPDLKEMVAFSLIILLLVLRPQGLFPRASWQRA